MGTMIALILVLCVGTCLGQGITEAQFEAQSKKFFDLEDLNKDGVVTKDELLSLFNRYDTSGNGEMSRHEYTESVCALAPEYYGVSHFIYDQIDVNNDHHVDAKDYDIFFPALDTNGDGQVTFQEYLASGKKSYEQFKNLGPHDLHAHTHSQCHTHGHH